MTGCCCCCFLDHFSPLSSLPPPAFVPAYMQAMHDKLLYAVQSGAGFDLS